MNTIKRKTTQRLTLQEFKSKMIPSNKQLEIYTSQVLAYGLEQRMGSSSGTVGAASNVVIRGNT